jgi:hypothetical protein
LRRLEAHIPAENTLSVRSAERQGFRIDRSRAPIAGLDAAAATIVIYARERQSVLCSPHMLDKRERGIAEGLSNCSALLLAGVADPSPSGAGAVRTSV